MNNGYCQVIKGMSVFHCHLLNHEDKGIMARILFE
jgi:FtsP/CotA-like multicopper oxidase with cupredoxin domain